MESLLLEWCVTDAIGKEQHYGGHDMVIGVIGSRILWAQKQEYLAMLFFLGLLFHYFVVFQYVFKKRWHGFKNNVTYSCYNEVYCTYSIEISLNNCQISCFV